MVIVFGYIKLFSTMENNEQKLNTQKKYHLHNFKIVK